MQIVVAASDEQWTALTSGRAGISWHRVESTSAFHQYEDAIAFFSLQDSEINGGYHSMKKPLIISSVVKTLTELNAPEHVYRINGWETFLSRPVWEIAGKIKNDISALFALLNIKINAVKDEPGFITARIISMIINEAYFAVEDNVSSKAEIDTAMKLGTNYPHGPFEWAELIGKKYILELLQELYKTDTRYKPSALLIKEVAENNS